MVLDPLVVACIPDEKYEFDNLGVDPALKCVSWRSAISALSLRMEKRICKCFSGVLIPLALRETILVQLFLGPYDRFVCLWEDILHVG